MNSFVKLWLDTVKEKNSLLCVGIDFQHGSGFDGIDLLQHRVAIIIENGAAIGICFLDPVFQVDADSASHPDGGLENR